MVSKLLSESESEIEALRNCKMVSYAGSACPDELEDYLSDCGGRIVSTFGLYVFRSEPALVSVLIESERKQVRYYKATVETTTSLGITFV